MFKGLTTIRYHAADLDAAKEWYTEVLGIEPYFQVPGYIEFRIGPLQSELGIMQHPTPVPEGVVMYWAVDDLEQSVARLEELGATVKEPIRNFGDNGFRAATMIDPFGNLVGVMENPHYEGILEAVGDQIVG
ncbi:MAG: VOC family protein [Thermomicrobiales bacterium]|nr:VOC family protein [Thermomicrobiales bacterium]